MKETKVRPFHIGKLIVGSFITFLGLVFLAHSTGWIDFYAINLDPQVIFPFLIVLLGLSMISTNTVRGAIISVVFSLLVLSVSLFLIFCHSDTTVFSNHYFIMNYNGSFYNK